ncbi:MAG: SDR family oxidoreductase [Gammaproteobacteria bacterium]|nr:SDR family oxidoreductase [Gammaproteobacteria bacterium]MCP5316744.1 SDR family oxidoreductase [Chromatiaceae bacterium]MCW5585543.1 SDR family oxidoreductase [Chromatiales bacterium]MCB1817340.1 SDR family oxidoreductase [Gammaproteobacteria bacterium]MCP5428961.1 SDR family oxidoreductase [Chromatiaceae bacterium]
MSEFNQSVVVITGAAGNLGRAVAQSFAAQGAHLALLDRNTAGIDDTIAACQGQASARAFPIDLIDPASVGQCIDDVLDAFGRVDILANIAGGFTMGPTVPETSDRDWDFMMNLNARSVFNMCRRVIPTMHDNGGGRIINVSARAAEQGKARMGPYCASKAAVLTLTESLAAENRFDNINVNCILPGTIDTPQNREAMPDADFDRWVPPAALADVVLFLASDAARCVTGAAIPVYGQS